MECTLLKKLEAAALNAESNIRAATTQKWNSRKRKRGAVKRMLYTDAEMSAQFQWLNVLLPRELEQLQVLPEDITARFADVWQNEEFAVLKGEHCRLCNLHALRRRLELRRPDRHAGR